MEWGWQWVGEGLWEASRGSWPLALSLMLTRESLWKLLISVPRLPERREESEEAEFHSVWSLFQWAAALLMP